MAPERTKFVRNAAHFREWSNSMAYDLGYITADGHIIVEPNEAMGKLRLECDTKDEEIILGIVDRIQSEYEVTRRDRVQDGKTLHHTYTIIYDHDLLDYLINQHQIKPRKTYTNPPLPLIPDQYISHYIRGYMDGDGGIWSAGGGTAKMFGLMGSLSLMQSMQDVMVRILGIPKLGCYIHNKHSKNPVYWVSWNDRTDLLKIYNWLYPEGQYPFLFRKRQLFEDYVKTFSPTNPSLRRDSTTNYAGVYKNKTNGRYLASTSYQKKTYCSGHYDTAEEAAFAYNCAVDVLRKGRALHNLLLNSVTAERREFIRQRVIQLIHNKLPVDPLSVS